MDPRGKSSPQKAQNRNSVLKEASGTKQALYLFYYTGTRRDRSGKHSIRVEKQSKEQDTDRKPHHCLHLPLDRGRERKERHKLETKRSQAPLISVQMRFHIRQLLYIAAGLRRDEREKRGRGKGDVPLVSVILHRLH